MFIIVTPSLDTSPRRLWHFILFYSSSLFFFRFFFILGVDHPSTIIIRLPIYLHTYFVRYRSWPRRGVWRGGHCPASRVCLYASRPSASPALCLPLISSRRYPSSSRPRPATCDPASPHQRATRPLQLPFWVLRSASVLSAVLCVWGVLGFVQRVGGWSWVGLVVGRMEVGWVLVGRARHWGRSWPGSTSSTAPTLSVCSL